MRVSEMADQPDIGSAAGAFHCKVRGDCSAATMQVVTRKAAFALRSLSVKGGKKTGVRGLPLAFPGDDVIVACVPANIKVLGGSERLRVAKVAGYLLVFFCFGVQAVGLALVVSGEIRIIARGAGVGHQFAKIPARKRLRNDDMDRRTLQSQDEGLLMIGLRGVVLRLYVDLRG